MTESIAPVTGSVISGPDVQAAIWFLGALSQVRVSGAQTGGAFALADHLARRGNASPVHVHDRDDETFFVLDGELRVFAGEDEHTAGPGAVAVLPRRLRRPGAGLALPLADSHAPTYLLGGPWLDATSPRIAFVIVGCGGLAGAAVTAVLLRKARRRPDARSRAEAAGPGW